MSLVFLSFFEGLGWQVDQRCLPKKWSVLQSCLVRFSCWRSQVTWWWDVLSQAELLKDHVCMSVRLVLLNGSASSYSRRPHSFPWTVNIRPNSRKMPWLSTYRPGFEQWWTLEAGRKWFFPTTTAEIKLQILQIVQQKLWNPGFPFRVMCAQHGLRMDNTGVLAMLVYVYLSWLVLRKASVWVNLFCAQANLREMVWI